MHPLDTVPLEGFSMVSNVDFVVHRRFDDVWRALGLSDSTPYDLPAAARHTVIERYGPGEHRCTVVATVNGRLRCSRGFRRVLAGHEVLEVQLSVAADQLLRTTFEPLRFGRTVIRLDAGIRQGHGHAAGPVDAQSAELRRQQLLRVRQRAVRRLREIQRQAQ